MTNQIETNTSLEEQDEEVDRDTMYRLLISAYLNGSVHWHPGSTPLCYRHFTTHILVNCLGNPAQAVEAIALAEDVPVDAVIHALSKIDVEGDTIETALSRHARSVNVLFDEGRFSIFEDVEMERERQDKLWGGPTNDDQHNRRDWLDFILHQVNQAETAATEDDGGRYRKQLMQIAALAVAGIESYDRKQMEGT